MPIYTLSAEVTVSAVCHVEAPDGETAREIAGGFNAVFGGERYGNSTWTDFVIDEIDGSPTNIKIVCTEGEGT